jgi:hypothetical protein
MRHDVMAEDDPEFEAAHDADRLMAAVAGMMMAIQAIARESGLCLHCLASDLSVSLTMNVASDMVEVGRPDEAAKLRQRVWDGITTEMPNVN